MKEVKFKGESCVVKFKFYSNGRPHITLHSLDDGMQVANCTGNIKSRIDTNLVFIKDYSENKGVYQALIDAEVIWSRDGKIEVGFNYLYVCRLRACRICENNESINNLCNKCALGITKNIKDERL